MAPPLGPVFAAHYEYRSTGPLPFSGGTSAVTAGWVRDRETLPDARLDAPSVVALLDAWWPALFSVIDTPLAIATLAFTRSSSPTRPSSPPMSRCFTRAA